MIFSIHSHALWLSMHADEGWLSVQHTLVEHHKKMTIFVHYMLVKAIQHHVQTFNLHNVYCSTKGRSVFNAALTFILPPETLTANSRGVY